MAYPTYGEIAQKLGIARCRGVQPNGQLCVQYNHRRGQVGSNVVHWADRGRVERAGIRRFLKMAAMLQLQEQEPRTWARLYLAQRQINEWASIIGVSFPAVLTDIDKLMTKAMLINVPTDEPLREEAMDWAQKT